MRIERLDKFEPINEANTLEKIKNWFSRNFGGSVKNIEDLLSDYRSKELDYVTEWKEILRDIEDLEISVETAGDAAEERSARRTIDRKRDLLSTVKNKHRKNLDVIFSKVKSEVKGKKDLEEYWGNRKAEVDADKIKDLGPEEANQISKYISNAKSDLYAEMDIKVEKMKEDLDKFKGDKSMLTAAKAKMDKVKSGYMEKIRQLRTKYTLIKKYT